MIGIAIILILIYIELLYIVDLLRKILNEQNTTKS